MPAVMDLNFRYTAMVVSVRMNYGSTEDAPDRMFMVRPQEPVVGNSQREWIISDIHDGTDHYVTDEVESCRSRTNTPSGDIEIFIDLEFFDVSGKAQRRAAFVLWSALNDAQSLL